MQKQYIFVYRIVITCLLFICAVNKAAGEEHPDFSGVWTIYREPGSSAFGGFGGASSQRPFTEEGRRRSEEYQKLLGPEVANPSAYCVDYGMPAMMGLPGFYPIEFNHRPDQLTIIYEVRNETRRIYLGEIRIPPEKRLLSRQGYSEGHWEGNVLVVETSDLTDGEDQGQYPHSDQAKIVERFSLGSNEQGTKIISYEMVMTDPVYYTEPIRQERKYAPQEGGYIIPFRCTDELWLELLEMRREQLKNGKPVDARMSDVYRAREEKE